MADPIIAFRGTAPGPDEPGKFHQGLPARSLAGAEYDALDNDQRALVRASPLYDYVSYREALKQQRADAQAAPESPATEAPAPEAAAPPAPEAEFAVPAPEEQTTEPAASEAGADAPPPAEAGA